MLADASELIVEKILDLICSLPHKHPPVVTSEAPPIPAQSS